MKSSTIKRLSFATTFSAGLALVLLSSCSGGGGGGTSLVSSTLDEASVQELAQNIMLEGDCIALSGVLSTSFSKDDSSSKLLTDNTTGIDTRSYALDSTVYGLISGSLRKHGEHDNGTDTLTYDFENYTNPTGDLQFGLSGSVSVVDHGTPGVYGPIMSNKTINTDGALNVSKSSYSRASSANYELQLSGYNQVYATVLFAQDDLDISSASAKNTSTNEEYKISNFSAKGYFTNSSIGLTGLKTTYTDPQVGSLTVESDVVNISRDSVQLPSAVEGTFGLTATDGTKAEAVITQSGNVKIYTVDGTTKVLVSELDCSGLVH